MLAPERVLTLGDARRFVAEHGFVPSAPATAPARLGIEIEWQTVCADDPSSTMSFDVLQSVAREIALPGGSRLTFEPGGQVELSSLPLEKFDACTAILADAEALTTGLAAVGIGLVGLGLLPGDPRSRPVRSPRYDAMEAHFDASGPAGRTMMRQTAAIQVNVDLGPERDVARRWRTAQALGPLLGAVFANSPFRDRAPSGWCSNRLAVWLDIERGRAVPIDSQASPASAWASYALRAPVMFIRATEAEFVPLREPLSFTEWILGGHELGWPTQEDLAYHLTTLFPPIRPRGWLELRMFDALPLEWSVVPAIVAVALLEDRVASERVAGDLEPIVERWEDAARDSLHDPDFARAARTCFAEALAALPRLDAAPSIIDVVERYRDRYVSRGRCPADDLVDAWTATGRLVPEPETSASLTQ
jgi:glutamate--cysteine ligase